MLWPPGLCACDMTKDADDELKRTWLLQFEVQLKANVCLIALHNVTDRRFTLVEVLSNQGVWVLFFPY